MGLFSNTAVDKGIAALFGKKITKDDLIPNAQQSHDETAKSLKTEKDSASSNEEKITKDRESVKAKKPVKQGKKEDLEDTYVRKTASAQEKADKRKAAAAIETSGDSEESESEEDMSDNEDANAEKSDEKENVNAESNVTQTKQAKKSGSKTSDPVKDRENTLFVKNVPYSVITDRKLSKAFKKTFGPGIKSVRFRSIALSEIVPRKVGFITQKFNETRDAVNSYIVYESKDRVIEAMKTMNGIEFENHHLFVDSVAKPRAQSTKRSVFIGNLSFDATEEELYKMFSDVGPIENLRIVRDRKFNIGKGFAYIQFEDVSNVQLALMKNDQEFQGRKLRVTRCSKNATCTQPDLKPTSKTEKSYKQKQTNRSLGGKPQKDNKPSKGKKMKQEKPGNVLEGERSKPGTAPQLGRKRKPRHENARHAKRAKK